MRALLFWSAVMLAACTERIMVPPASVTLQTDRLEVLILQDRVAALKEEMRVKDTVLADRDCARSHRVGSLP